MTTAIKELITCFEETGPKLSLPGILERLRVIDGVLTDRPAPKEREPMAERFEAMHAKGDVWITTIAAAAIARGTFPPSQSKTLTQPQQEPVAKVPGMAVRALAGEIVEALLADDQDGGYDLTAGMFGANFSALVRRWAAAEWYTSQPAQQDMPKIGCVNHDCDKCKAQPQQERWCPDVCPITGLPFFMWIEHHETGQMVPTYGGPYDSHTIPERDKDGSYCRERYDHDNGWWVTDEVEDVGIQIVSDQAYVSEDEPTAQRKPLTDELAVLRLVSEEYNAWIHAHAGGWSYDEFLKQRLATRAKGLRDDPDPRHPR